MSDVTPTPFFQSQDPGDLSRRRLLVISYHFPPDRAVGARRWEKLARFAAERGFALDVITCRAPDTPLAPAEQARMDALPAGTRVFAVPLSKLLAERLENTLWSLVSVRKRKESKKSATDSPAPTATAVGSTTIISTPTRPDTYAREEVRWELGSPRGYVRLYWTWLDSRRVGTWARHVARLATTLGRSLGASFGAAGRSGGITSYAAVISSGPPHMTHDAGRRISEELGIPFVMDMRDPWRLGERVAEGVATPFWYMLAGYYEKRAVHQASLVVANTEVACQNLRATYPERASDIITVMNGADDDPLPESRHGAQFVIAHAGTVYLDRDPRGLFQAAARVIREVGATPDDFRLAFMGELTAVGGFPVLDVARQEGIAGYVTTEPPQPHAKAMEFMADATMLVTMSGGNMAAIPAKTFECVRFAAWVLALSAAGSATDLVLRDSGADVVAPSNVAAIEEVIRTRYQAHRRGKRPPRIGDDARFSRRAQATILFDALEARL